MPSTWVENPFRSCMRKRIRAVSYSLHAVLITNNRVHFINLMSLYILKLTECFPLTIRAISNHSPHEGPLSGMTPEVAGEDGLLLEHLATRGPVAPTESISIKRV